MAVQFKKKTIKKSQVKTQSAQVTALAKIGEMTDPLHTALLGAKGLRAQLKKLEAKIKTQKERYLESYNIVYGVDDGVTVQGKKHAIKVAACSKKRSLSKIDECFDMLEAVQDGLFAELASVSLGDLDKYLTPEQLAVIIETVQDPMDRTITAVAE